MAKSSTKDEKEVPASGVEVKKRKGSLKNQLRCKKRLLSKITDEEVKAKIEHEMREIEEEIKLRNLKEKEKKFASKYHRIKFVERQKLTRLEKKCKKKLEEATVAADFEEIEKYKTQLEQICMDQLYVAYYPNDRKYISLFANGIRLKDDEKTAKRRDDIRQHIVDKIKNKEIKIKKTWVNMSVLKAKGFEIDMDNVVLEDEKSEGPMSAAMKEAAAMAEKMKNDSNEKSKKEKLNSSNDEAMVSSGVDEDEKEDVKEDLAVVDTIPTVGDSDSSSEEDDSSSSSSSSSDSDSSSSLSSSDSDSSDDDEDNDDAMQEEESDDDFLVEDSGENNVKEVFAKAKREKGTYGIKGNKSQGWKTQRQRPGEFKKKRQRY
jgi:hypothetical protein